MSTVTLGILGGGQLAKMLASAALERSFDLNFYVGDTVPVVGNLGELFTHTEGAFEAFCKQSDVILFEHEHISDNQLALLRKNYADKCPGIDLLELAGDRRLEKKLFNDLAIPHARVITVEQSDIHYPVVVKSCIGGYDGKGQKVCKNKAEVQEFLANKNQDDFIIEEFIAFESECSLVAVANAQGGLQAYDITENIHDNGILIKSINKKDSSYFNEAHAYCQKIAEATNYIGIFAVEFFVTAEGLCANEISPRVHNSGHWTMDGAYFSQFENHLRATLNLPLGNTRSHSRIVMHNLIGGLNDSDLSIFDTPNSKCYWYGKQSRAGRKLGHVNTCDD